MSLITKLTLTDPQDESVAALRQGKCPSRNTSALTALAVNSGSNEIIYIKIFQLPLLMRRRTCHEQRSGAATEDDA